MSFNSGNMLSLTPYISKSIMVGNGVILPVTHIGQKKFPHSHNHLVLNDVLISNKMVKNLVYVQKFIVDNSVYVTFDPLWFYCEGL